LLRVTPNHEITSANYIKTQFEPRNFNLPFYVTLIFKSTKDEVDGEKQRAKEELLMAEENLARVMEESSKKQESEVKNLLEEKEVLLRKISKTDAELNNARESTEAKEKELDKSRSEIAKLTVDLRALEEERSSLANQFESHKEERLVNDEKLEKRYSDLVDRNTELTGELQAMEVMYQNQLTEAEKSKADTVDEVTKQYETQLQLKEEQYREEIREAMSEKDSSVNSLTLEEMRKEELEGLEARHASFLDETRNNYEQQQSTLVLEHERRVEEKNEIIKKLENEAEKRSSQQGNEMRTFEN